MASLGIRDSGSGFWLLWVGSDFPGFQALDCGGSSGFGVGALGVNPGQYTLNPKPHMSHILNS